MPIYCYRCTSCGLQQDVMQKISDATLTCCPECGKESFVKQLTAAGFQLKGSGYYVTDFKNGPKKPEGTKPDVSPATTATATTKPDASLGSKAAAKL